MPTLVVHTPGALTTVQDLGRPGHGRVGLGPSGALDPWSVRLANILLGNPAGAAALEITGPGASFGFYGQVAFCLVGGDLGARLEGRAVVNGEVVVAREGQALAFTARRSGFRAILAVQGGIESAGIAGSRSTDMAAQLPRPRLRAGDMLEIALASSHAAAATPLQARRRDDLLQAFTPPAGPDPTTLRIVPQPHADLGTLIGPTLTLDDRCNRTGYRLIPDAPARTRSHTSARQRSEPLAPGSIQLPPDGNPVLLLADQPTVGGYPVLAHLATVDRTLAAQLAPGDRVRFAPMGVDEARALARARMAQLEALRGPA